jgi:nitrate reductase assembly molybdenum cofactor insertion protein NarJ
MKKKIKEQIEYDGPERMDQGIQSKLEKGETPMSDNPGLPRKDNDELDNSFEQLVASKRFRDVVEKVKRYTGVNEVTQNQLMNLQGMLMQAVRQVKQIESNNEGYLEQLAVDVVKKELSLPDDAFQYDVELTSMPGQIDMSKMRKDSEEPEDEDVLDQFGVEENEAEDDLENFMAAFEKFDLEKAKRRFINTLIQGASKKGHYMYHLVKDELEKLDPKLLNLYGVLMSVNDLLYWIMPDDMVMKAAESGQGMEGKEEVDDTTDPPTIKAKGLFFPILIHELLKGVYEVLGTQGLPDDPKAADMVMASQDTLPYEIWDLRLGPVIWEKFMASYPEKLYDDDLREIQNYLFSRFSSLTTDEFFDVAKMIMSGSDDGKKVVAKMVDEIIEELKSQDYEDAISQYDDDDDDDDDDLSGLLDGLGISLS